MAEGFARMLGLECESAGTMPGDQVDEKVIEVMKEKKIDISSQHPKIMTVDMVKKADMVIIMGCSVEEVCPRPIVLEMQKKMIDWGIEDPKGKPMEKIREIRDQIGERIKELIR
jgi:Protein-tyrosine-phosphatase